MIPYLQRKESLMSKNLDPGARRVIAMLRTPDAPSIESLTPGQTREAFRVSRALLAPEPSPVASAVDLTAPGPGGAIPLRLYRGQGTGEDEDLPVVLFLHSGGWVNGGLDTHDGVCRTLATLARCAVVAVDYRLAPEHRFPAAVEDSWAALAFMAQEARGLRLDPHRIAICGESAGGNLAAVVALMARDAQAPALCLQILLYPATDFTRKYPHLDYLEGAPLTRENLGWFQRHYVRDGDRHDWRASPLLARDLSGAPPTFLVTCGFDPLEDEGRAFADRLCRAGVALRHRHFPGQIHGFLTMGRFVPETTILLGEIAAALDRAFNPA
jgi:acetyl esterase